jgi:CheY-like chemotaxis protein
MTRPNPPGSPTVLLVEDEPLVRMLNLEILHEAGFRVVDANDADEAFEVLRRRQDRIGAVLTDVDMPGSLNGFEFARLVSQGWPEVGILVTSGKMAPAPGDLPPRSAFLAKPYMPATLVAELRRLLEQLALSGGP